MSIKKILDNLEQTSEFKKWKSKNKNSYFSHAFKIPQEMKPEEWQLGFYNPKKDNITTFVVSQNSIEKRPEEEVFKKDESRISGIDFEKVSLDFETVLDAAANFQNKNFPKDKSIKTIAILQNLPNLGNVWNITYVTQAFNTLNMKIDAKSGNVIEHKLSSIFELREK
ncbi:MAG TPA: hypothetical protein VI564_07440 [Candidatus Nanoarchaeia archaeon]|nr:hypothetical protein [Candidatus Nanoarchaeia archaeon]